MNLLSSLIAKFRPEPEPTPLLGLEDSERLKADFEALQAPAPVKPRGRVVKETKRPQYSPGFNGRSGGRIVKAMPRELQQIKQAQEKVEDELA